MIRAMHPTNVGDVMPAGIAAESTAIVDLRDPAHPVTLSYGALRAAIDAVARGFLAHGFDGGAHIGFLADNGWRTIAAAMGLMKAGFVPVPLNHHLAPDAIAAMAAEIKLGAVLYEQAYDHLLPAAVPAIALDGAGDKGGSDWPYDIRAYLDPGPFTAPPTAPDQECVVLCTSGSTGRPKAVPLTHGGQLWWMKQLRGFTRADAGAVECLPVAVPFFHMSGFFLGMFCAYIGARAIVMRNFDSKVFIRAAADHGCSFIATVTPVLARIVREQELLERCPLADVHAIEIGAAPLTPKLLAAINKAFPRARILNHYGSTEAGWVVFGDHPDGKTIPSVSLGHAIDGLDVRLVGPHAPDRGVLEVRGPSVATRYLNSPRDTAARFRDGWFVTNDEMWRDKDGFYYFSGRADDMFICNGENIFPRELELLIEQHPAVIECCVVPAPDDMRGQIPTAFIVRKPGQAISVQEIQEFARSKGPAYQYPRIVTFLDALPHAGSEKIDRGKLAAVAAELAAQR